MFLGLRTVLCNSNASEFHDQGLKWDLIKMEIRGFTMKYSKGKAEKYRDKDKLLHRKVNDLRAIVQRKIPCTKKHQTRASMC